MTKEQIIIDGVDVSGCLFYQSNFEEDYDVRIKHFCSNWHNSCESSNNSNCYFKQLARKTQECEQLKKLADANPNSTLRLRNEIRDLQAVSVKYKEALEEIEAMVKTCLNQDVCILCPYSDKCENPYDVLVYESSRGILDIISGFAYGRSETSPDSEQIEPTCAKHKRQNSVSVEQIQDNKAKNCE